MARRNTLDEDADDLVAAVTESVLAGSRAIVGIAVRSMAAVESSITMAQYRALVALEVGPQNVSALAKTLEIHASTATRLCDRLLAKGLIERETSAENRREVTVARSAAGDAVVRTVTARRRREIRRLVSRLEPVDQRRVAEAFETLAAAAEHPSDHAWKLGWTG